MVPLFPPIPRFSSLPISTPLVQQTKPLPAHYQVSGWWEIHRLLTSLSPSPRFSRLMTMFIHPEHFWRLLHFFTICDVYTVSLSAFSFSPCKCKRLTGIYSCTGTLCVCMCVCVGVVGGALCTCLPMIVTQSNLGNYYSLTDMVTEVKYTYVHCILHACTVHVYVRTRVRV